jgi:multiple sugar transport system ATP-binding protein
VAAFIGSPAMNLVDATVDGDDVAFGQFRVTMPPGHRPAVAGERVVLGVRPESFEDAAFAPGRATIEVGVEVVEDLGSDAHVFFHVDAPPITAEILEAAADSSLLSTDRALFAARVDPRSSARPGRGLELAVDPTRFHFFDPATGARLETVGASAELQAAR